MLKELQKEILQQIEGNYIRQPKRKDEEIARRNDEQRNW